MPPHWDHSPLEHGWLVVEVVAGGVVSPVDPGVVGGGGVVAIGPPSVESPRISASQQVTYGAVPSLKTQRHWNVYFPSARLSGTMKVPVHRDLSVFSQNRGQFWNP